MALTGFGDLTQRIFSSIYKFLDDVEKQVSEPYSIIIKFIRVKLSEIEDFQQKWIRRRNRFRRRRKKQELFQ